MTPGTASQRPSDEDMLQPGRLGWKTAALVLALYAACLGVATHPRVMLSRSTLPSCADPMMHIWTMKWYRTCLLEGRSPFLSPEIHHPVGAPLGLLPPMTLQAALFIPLSFIIKNDILIYNILWFASFLLAGMGVFLLAWRVLRDRASAALAGLLAMLGGPMTFFGRSELEQVGVGTFPLFLLAWMRWVDRPSRGGLLAATGSFVLMAMTAPYFVVLGAFPAGLYVLSGAWREGRRGAWPWLRARAAGFAGFLALAGGALPLLFANQVWAALHGFSIARTEREFDALGASFWGYIVPTLNHPLARVLPEFAGANGLAWKVPSYLGVVTLGLIAYAASRRARLPRAAFWWAGFAMLVVLSLGSYWTIGAHRVPLPGYWLRRYFPPFRPIRVPGRFNLFAAVFAAVLAGAGLKHLLARIPDRRRRAAVVAGLGLLALADLGTVPFAAVPVPPMPGCYAFLKRNDPNAAILEVPSPLGNALSYESVGIRAYWQTIHRLRVTGGYTASTNAPREDLTTSTSPFHIARLTDPGYLARPDSETYDLVRDVAFADQVWLYLWALRLDYVVVHRWDAHLFEPTMDLNRVEALLGHARVYRDDATAVYARAKLREPTRPTILAADGWHGPSWWRGRPGRPAERSARLAVYNPDPSSDLRLTLDAAGFRRARTVRVLSGGVELARWSVPQGEIRSFTSPPIRLPAGPQILTVESDGEERPGRPSEAPIPGDLRPISLVVSAIRLAPADGGRAASTIAGPAQAVPRR